jgi:hypothetical protein
LFIPAILVTLLAVYAAHEAGRIGERERMHHAIYQFIETDSDACVFEAMMKEEGKPVRPGYYDVCE